MTETKTTRYFTNQRIPAGVKDAAMGTASRDDHVVRIKTRTGHKTELFQIEQRKKSFVKYDEILKCFCYARTNLFKRNTKSLKQLRDPNAFFPGKDFVYSLSL